MYVRRMFAGGRARVCLTRLKPTDDPADMVHTAGASPRAAPAQVKPLADRPKTTEFHAALARRRANKQHTTRRRSGSWNR